jgi:hypothetical protein
MFGWGNREASLSPACRIEVLRLRRRGDASAHAIAHLRFEPLENADRRFP